jgi:hypothetical protein
MRPSKIHPSTLQRSIVHHYSSSHATKQNANFSCTQPNILIALGIRLRVLVEENLLWLGDEAGEAVLKSLAVLVGGMLGEAVGRLC